jgi:hypothetical protein
MSQGRDDLTGDWSGFYSYPDGGPPNAFEAKLNESSGCVTGTTTELADMGELFGQPLHAVIDGHRAEKSVSFLKMYDCADEGYDVVRYEGTLDAEGNEIEGRWTVPGIWSGTFLMVRHGGANEELEEEIGERIDAR